MDVPKPLLFFPFFSSSTRFYYENLCIVEYAGLLFRCIFCSTLGEVDHDLFVICLFKFCVQFFFLFLHSLCLPQLWIFFLWSLSQWWNIQANIESSSEHTLALHCLEMMAGLARGEEICNTFWKILRPMNVNFWGRKLKIERM